MKVTMKTWIYVILTTALAGGLIGACAARSAASIPGPPPWASHYQQVWAQDFSTMTGLSQLGVSDTRIGNGDWIAHTPGNTDWFTFQNPSDSNHPFGVGNGYLTIRVQKDGRDPNHWFGGYSGGLLSSLDGAGKGFAQQYGYFECAMHTPGGPNTWPAFWLLDAPSVTHHDLSAAEIDVTESYGNWGTGPGQKPPGDPDEDAVTWHLWGHNGQPTRANGSFVREPGMTTGFHTYGVDIEPTGITWYFDRRKIWWAPIYPEAERPMYVLLNLALGGGNHNNAKGDGYDWSLTPDPSDLKAQYVAVWASPASPNYNGPPASPTDLKATPGNSVVALSWKTALGAASYNIYRDSRRIAGGVSSTAYIDHQVVNGHTYTYRVAAVSARGSSQPSAPAPAAPIFGPPMAPSHLQALSGDRQITLSWRPSPDAVTYNIYRGTTAGAESSRPAAAGITAASFVDKGITNGQPYFYTVAAVSAGGASHHSNQSACIPAVSAEAAAVSYAPGAPNVNGRAVWDAAPVYGIDHLGLGTSTSTSGIFQVMWDPANLYCRFTVIDSALVKGSPDYNGDAVEVYIDARNTKRPRYDATDFRYTLGYGHTTLTTPEQAALTGVKFQRQDFPGGYRAQIAIPWKSLGVAPFPGMSIGLDAAIDDASSAVRGRTSALFWHDTDANDYQNPSLFGNAALQPRTVTPPPPNGVYRVVNVGSRKVLDVPGASTANVPLDQAPSNGGANQQWNITSLGGGSYAIRNVKSGSVVDCSPTYDVGHPAVQWPISGTPSATQRFTLTPIDGHYPLMNVYSGRALDAPGGPTPDAIVQSISTGASSQLWDLVGVAKEGRL